MRGSGSSPKGGHDKSQFFALCFRQITMAEILSDALKENQCEGLLRLIAGLTEGLDGQNPHGRREREVITERRID
jgi:hypothetical protein